MDNNPHTFNDIKRYLEDCRKYKPLTEELIQKIMDDYNEQQQKDLEEDTVYYYLNGWQKCSGKTYRKVFKKMYNK